MNITNPDYTYSCGCCWFKGQILTCPAHIQYQAVMDPVEPLAEDSFELINLERQGKVARPEIAKLDLWPIIKPFVLHSRDAGKSRQHIYLDKNIPPDLIRTLRKAHVRCANPECNNAFPAIRLHRNGDRYSIHPSGPRDNGHGECASRPETELQTGWLYLTTNQAGRSMRMKKLHNAAKQTTLGVENGELIL